MKKIITYLTIGTILLSLVVMPVYAQTNDIEFLYKDKFIEYELGDYYDLHFYDERYYHEDAEGNIDWAFLYAYTSPFAEVRGKFRFGGRVIVTNELCYPFSYKYGLYDVKEDKFVCFDKNIDYTKYEGLEEYVNSNLGYLVGDADLDYEISILDATLIQRRVAQLVSISDIRVSETADVDDDGDITVLDATTIQMKLAKVEDTATTE